MDTKEPTPEPRFQMITKLNRPIFKAALTSSGLTNDTDNAIICLARMPKKIRFMNIMMMLL
jgi:hypothetical protein